MQPDSPSSAPVHRPHRLDAFAACIDLAVALAADFDHAHVTALVDLDGDVVDGVVLSDPAHTIDHAVGYALCLDQRGARPADVLFFSVAGAGADRVRAADLATWRRMRAVFPDWPSCRDWFITDGEAIRSMAMTDGPERSWSGERGTPPDVAAVGSPHHAAPPKTSTSAKRQAGDA